MFIARGFAATTLDDVGKAAGLNKRAIYELVGDKEQLFREVCRHSYSAIVEADPIPSISGHSLLTSLQALARRLIEHACSDQTIALERLVIAESKRFPELIKEIVQAGHLEGNRSIAAYLAELRSLGMIEFDDLWQASELFYDLIIGQIGLRHVLGHTTIYVKDIHINNRVDLFIKIHKQ